MYVVWVYNRKLQNMLLWAYAVWVYHRQAWRVDHLAVVQLVLAALFFPVLSPPPSPLLCCSSYESWTWYIARLILVSRFRTLVCTMHVQPISYIETSAKEAVKVEGAFLEVVQMALINSAQQPPEM